MYRYKCEQYDTVIDVTTIDEFYEQNVATEHRGMEKKTEIHNDKHLRI